MELIDSSDGEQPARNNQPVVRLNQTYAKAFEERKEQQEIKRLQKKYGKNFNEEDSEPDVVEDEFASLYTQEQEDAFAKVLWNIRNRTTELGDENREWWPEPDHQTLPSECVQKSAPETLKRQLTSSILKENSTIITGDESVDRFNCQKRKLMISDGDADGRLKEKFMKNVEPQQVSSDDVLVSVGTIAPSKTASEEEIEGHTSLSGLIANEQQNKSFEFDEIFGKVRNDNNGDKEFLKSYFRQHGWKNCIQKDATGEQHESDENDNTAKAVMVKDHAHLEDSEEILPFTSPTIRQYPRGADPQSLREKSTRRQEGRERKQARLLEQGERHQQEIDRMKNLQKDSIHKRINLISKISGSQNIKKQISENFLHNDFDEKEWDEQMAKLFDDDFYEENEQQQESEGKNDLHDAVSWASEDILFESTVEETEYHNNSTKRGSSVDPKLRDELCLLQKEIKELQDSRLDDHVKPSCTFRYTGVPSDGMSLTIDDILRYDDRKLSDIAPLRWYAPYVTDKERRKFKYMSIAKKRDTVRDEGARKSRFKPSQKYRQDSSNAVSEN